MRCTHLDWISHSQHVQGKKVHALGQALDIKTVRGKFTTFERLLNKAAVDACPNCLHLFTHGNIQQYDAGTGLFTGELPSDCQLPQNWAERVSTETQQKKVC